MIHALLLALLPAPMPATPQTNVNLEASEPDSVLAVYDLRPLMPSFDHEPGWNRTLTFAADTRFFEDESTLLTDLWYRSGSDLILDILARPLAGELQYEGREISLDGDSRLLVLAPQAVHDRVKVTLQALEGAISAAMEFTVDVVEIPGQQAELWPKKNVVPAESVDGLIASALSRGGEHRRFPMQVSTGRTTWLEQMRRTPILVDYDVEIAQGSFISDPIEVDVEEGVRMLLRGVPVPGGVAISTLFQSAELLSVKERPLGSSGAVGREGEGGFTFVGGPRKMQAADLLHRSVAFDAFLPDDSALVFATAIDLEGQESTQVVFVRRTGGSLQPYVTRKLPGTSQTLIAVNSELFSLPTMKIDHAFAGESFDRPHPLASAELSAELSLFLFDWMDVRFKMWQRIGPWAVMITDPAWDKNAAADLDTLVKSWRPATELMSLEVTLSAQGEGHVPIRASIPARSGSGCGLSAGILTSALYDYDVEVASYSCVADPFVIPFMNGISLGVTPSATTAGHALDIRGTARVIQSGPRASFDPEDDMLGSIDQPVFDQLLVDERRLISSSSDGATTSIGGESKAGERPILQLEIGVK